MALLGLPVVSLLDLGRGRSGAHLKVVIVLCFLNLHVGRGTRGGALFLILLILNIELELTQVTINPLAELLVPNFLLQPSPVRRWDLHQATPDLCSTACKSSHRKHCPSSDAHAEAFDETERALLLCTDNWGPDGSGYSSGETSTRSLDASYETICGIARPRFRHNLRNGIGAIFVFAAGAGPGSHGCVWVSCSSRSVVCDSRRHVKVQLLNNRELDPVGCALPLATPLGPFLDLTLAKDRGRT
mmetsp:Transcript_25798/g.65009  ORF Transcript_25798/g.65009 Transcript_25798/m.65009 type:complete len:244 (+) Transcript_25798:1140-1871(+)